MNPCDLLERYLDRELSPAELAGFDRHLTGCERCAEQVAEWTPIEIEIQNGARIRAARSSDHEDVERRRVIAAVSEQPRRGSSNRWAVWLVPAAAAVCIVVGLMVVALLPAVDEKEIQEALTKFQTTRFTADRAPVTEVLEPSSELVAVPVGERMLAHIGHDRVGVDGGGRVAIIEAGVERTELHLEQGWIACAVPPGAGGRRFFALVGERRFTVEVKGTRFAVHYSPHPKAAEAAGPTLQVAVADGVVAVSERDRWNWNVAAGEQLDVVADGPVSVGPISRAATKVIERLLSEPDRPAEREPEAEPVNGDSSALEPTAGAELPAQTAPETDVRPIRPAKTEAAGTDEPSATTYEEIEALVVSGNCAEAMSDLERRLADDPTNGRMWRLLASCRRKTGDLAGAVAAYRKVIQHGSPAMAAAARFRAGVILQDRLGRPGEAAALFEEYLTSKGPKQLSAEAWLRLGRAWWAVGKHDQARGAFEKVVERHGGTAAAVEARELLGVE
jgi:TolA-binding protein